MTELSGEREQRVLYAESKRTRGTGRNDLRSNRGVLFQTLAFEASFVRAIYQVGFVPEEATVLDVGCGSGGTWYQFVRLGVRPENITGLEIQSERLEKAREVYPRARLIHGDARVMDVPSGSFDIVFESTMFATLPDRELRARIAGEMVRACRPGGYLILADWRIPKVGDHRLRALSRRELRSLFAVGGATRLEGAFNGALIPPVGRFMSKWLPWAYFLVATCCPVLVGQVVYVLRKEIGTE